MINNLITVSLMLTLLGIVIVINTVLGTVFASKSNDFDWNKFKSGVSKAIIILICIIAFCFTLELLPIVLNRVGIVIPADIITIAEIIVTTLTAYKKYTLDCLDKFKTIIGTKKEGE